MEFRPGVLLRRWGVANASADTADLVKKYR